MKRTTIVLVLTILSSLAAAYGQVTPSQDSYTNSADPTTNYGSKTLLDVDGATQISYIQFNLASIPSGAVVTQATLKLYVNSVTTAGSFNVDYVNGSWSEGTIDSSNAPPLGTTIAPSVPVVAADKNQYLLINVTSALQAWLNGSEMNNGIALVANGNLNVTFDSKENTTTSHAAELDVVFASGDGTITGVNTASGSGIQGGGTSGTLNLSLTTSCISGQILSWNGSAWVCKTASGTGTVTSVATGLGLTGGPITNAGTLSIDTTKIPLLTTSNTFTGNQTFSGNVSVGGSVTGTQLISSVGTGTAPLSVNSTTQVPNLNASFLGGLPVGGFAQVNAINNFTQTQFAPQITSTGSIEADNGGTNSGNYVPGVQFGPINSGETIASAQATGSPNQGGLDFYTNYLPRLQITNSGSFMLNGVVSSYNGTPTYANGIPSIVMSYSFYSPGGGTNVYTTLITPVNDGVYRITVFNECWGTSGGNFSFDTQFLWTLPTGATGEDSIGGATCASMNLGDSGTALAHVKGGTPLQFLYTGMDAPFQTTILIEQLM